MKTIGIIGAMEVEVAILKEKMEDVRIIKKASMDFYEGILAGKKVVVVRSGIGKVNAGICAQILADVFSVDAIINTGIAGSLNKNINIGDIVLSTDVVQHDMDATGFGYRKGQIPQMPVFFFNADDNLRRLAAEVCKEVNPDIQVFEGRIASGDQFVCDQDVKNRIVSEFSAYATEMEGAAIGQAAYLNEIPFLVVRAISDKADGSAQMDYSEFEKAAVDHSVRLTFKYAGAYLKNHSAICTPHFAVYFFPNSVAVARYGAIIRAKSSTNCDVHLAESLFQTRFGAYLKNGAIDRKTEACI